MKILLTGGKGFVGSHLIQEIVARTDWQIISLERLPFTTNHLNRLANIPEHRLSHFYHDFRAPLSDDLLADLGKIDTIIHNGAEVHAIRSLTDPKSFVESNAIGVFNMLETAVKLKVKSFLYCSSAEVFGAASDGSYHSEDAALNPSNPYSAAKAGGEMLVKSYIKSFGLPAMIVRTMNTYGETQDSTKFVPMVVKKALTGDVLKIHVDSDGKPGCRQWIYVKNYVDAILLILKRGYFGESYNVAGDERDNLMILDRICGVLPSEYCPKWETVLAPPTHDLRYAISGQKLLDLGWIPPYSFERSFEDTVKWAYEHQEWL